MFNRLPQYVYLVISLAFALIQTCENYTFDYDTYPNIPFNYEHLELDVTIESDQSLIRGIATYTMSTKIDGISSIPFHAGDISVESIEVNDEEREFSFDDDFLYVQLLDTLEKDHRLEVKITWQSNSKFGLFKDYEGNLWSSKNPLTHRHWLPTYDHPRVKTTVDAYFTIPKDTEVMFNGNLVTSEPVSESKKKVHWQADQDISITSLGFVQGDFVISEMTAGFTKLRLFAPEFGFDEDVRSELIVEAARLKRAIEDELSFEFPWEALNIVVLADNYWEERTHGSGTIYLYERLGSLQNQLKRGIYTQWFGEYLQTEEYFHLENDGVNELLPVALHLAIESDPVFIDNPDTLFKLEYWNTWQESIPEQQPLFKETIQRSLPEFVRSLNGIIRFEDYASFWYDQTGLSWFTPDYSYNETSTEDSTALTTSYNAAVYLDEVDFELTLLFNLEEGSGEKLFTLQLNEFSFEGVTSQEVSFTGDIDTVRISIDASTEFISFNSGSIDISQVNFTEFPLYFLLNQLRSDDPSERVKAALLLKSHAENPDLQLALSDILNFEEDSNVIAAVYETLALITDGAIGTEEQFIAGVSNSSTAIQVASIKALINYPENDYVKSTLRSTVLRSDNDSLFNAALEVYESLASTSEMLALTRSMQRVDTVGFNIFSILESSDSLAFNEEVNQLVEEYIQFSNPYSVRQKAYSFLSENDLDTERWSDRIRALINDRDPRIRVKGYESIPRFKSTSEALVFLNTAKVNEFDTRVLLIANELKSSLSELEE